MPSLGGLSSKDYADKLFRYWRLKDVLLLVSAKERQVYIKWAHEFCRTFTHFPGISSVLNAITTKWQNNDFAGGIDGGIDKLLSAIRFGYSMMGAENC